MKTTIAPKLSTFSNLSSSLALLISVSRVLPAKGSVHETNTANRGSSILYTLAQFWAFVSNMILGEVHKLCEIST